MYAVCFRGELLGLCFGYFTYALNTWKMDRGIRGHWSRRGCPTIVLRLFQGHMDTYRSGPWLSSQSPCDPSWGRGTWNACSTSGACIRIAAYSWSICSCTRRQEICNESEDGCRVFSCASAYHLIFCRILGRPWGPQKWTRLSEGWCLDCCLWVSSCPCMPLADRVAYRAMTLCGLIK